MRIKTESITLLRATHESFTGADGSLVEYDKAVLLDDEGNKFEMAIDKSVADDVIAVGEKTDGVADIEAFISGRGGKTVIKFRLLGFEPN